jgi:N-acetylneuraminic acid mutarotase
MHPRALLPAGALLLTLLGCGEDPTAPQVATPAAVQPSVTAQALGQWIVRADYPVGVINASSASITDPATLRTTLYVVGGHPAAFSGPGTISNAVRAYDVSANVWRKRAPLPIPIETANGAVELGGRIYLSGGFTRRWDESRKVWRRETLKSLFVYDPATDRWTRRRDMPTTTAGGVSAAYQGSLYVAAGSQLWRYAPATDRWVELEPTPQDVFEGGGGFIGGKLYLVSWQSPRVDVYDPRTNSWSAGPALPTNWGCSPASTTLQARLYLIGCYDQPSDSYVALVLNPAAGGWSRVALPSKVEVEGFRFTLSRVWAGGQQRLELVGESRPGNNLQFVP